jgi:hypothetical protein
MKLTLFGIVLVVFIVFISFKIYNESAMFNLKCIVSDINGKKYCVRERAKLGLAADLLARTSQKLEKLTKYLDNTYPDRENINRLVKGFNPDKISETLPTSEFTAYSENKGEKLAFCLNKNKNGKKLIDENTLMFVALHELAHIMTESVGHNEVFWKNFKFLIENAKEIKVYVPVDYKKDNGHYCGMDLTDNPYYDL